MKICGRIMELLPSEVKDLEFWLNRNRGEMKDDMDVIDTSHAGQESAAKLSVVGWTLPHVNGSEGMHGTITVLVKRWVHRPMTIRWNPDRVVSLWTARVTFDYDVQLYDIGGNGTIPSLRLYANRFYRTE